jgi:hypothetical protein
LACRSCNFVWPSSNPGPQFRVASWRPGLLLGRHLPVKAATKYTSNAHADRPFDPGKGLARLTVDQLWLSSFACLPGYVCKVGCKCNCERKDVALIKVVKLELRFMIMAALLMAA